MKQFLQLTRQYSLLVLLLLTMNVGWGQVTLVEYQFENNLNPESGSIGSPNLTFSIAPTYNTGATGQSLVTGTAASANGAFIELTISTTGYQDIEVSWAGRTSNNLNPGAWQLTANSGSGFGGVIFTQSLTTSFNNTGFQSLGSAFNNNSTVTIRITANNPQPRNLRIDDLIIRGVVLTSSPSISVNPTSLSNLNYVVGSGPSTSKSYEVSAANLVGAGNITVTAPTNFEISTDNVNFFATRNLPFAGGLITGQPVTVYVRLVESLAINSYNGIITHFGGTAPQVDLAVSGAVISPPGWQITAANSNFTIDFDNTVSGVNNGAFSANNPAASQSPLSGQLDTDAWEYNIDGTSSSVLNAASFPGSFPVSVGPNNGGLLATGINVVEIPAAQGGTGRAFAVQPTGGHWTAGHITLRAQNKTGVPITSFLISYDAYYFNDQARSNEFFFLYSTDNITYTRVSALDVVSPEAAAGTPEWVQNSRSTLISSLNIPTDGYLYLRWAGDDISGSGSRDEFAFDNIVLNLNPSTTNFYYSGSGDLTNTSNWGTNTDGSGTNPANFTNGLQVFNIRNTASVSLSSTWTVSGSGSKVVVGDGTSATTFTIPSFHALSGAIDVSDNTTLAIENSTFPTLGDLNAGSTVIYRGLTNINLPLSAYGNLTFDNTSVADPGDNNNLNYRGNFSLINGATFNCAGINLQATGTGNQTITGNGNTLTVRSFDRNGNAVKTSGRLILAANTPITVSNSIIMNNSGAANRFEDGGNTITVFNNVTLDGNADGYLFTGTLRFAGDTDNSNLRADGTNNVAAKGELNNLVIAKEGTRTMGIRGNVASEVTTIKGNFVVESTSTGSLFFNEGMIRVGGDFIYSSSTQDLNVSTSTVVLNGTSSQTINFSQNRSLNAFTINKLSGTATISGAGELVVSNVLTLASGTLNTGNRLVLRSSSTNTARVAPIGVGASITGNVAVERYIPAKRAWRLLASPVRGENNSIFANWQNNGTDNGRGLLLWHPSPVGTATPTSSNSGLFVGAQPNIYSYVNGAWAAVTNTNTTNISSASNNNAFMVFVTGPHASNNFTTTSAVTTS
ncbi:MAG: beta strand repeat-containing protein, partial [Flavobacterium sp.]